MEGAFAVLLSMMFTRVTREGMQRVHSTPGPGVKKGAGYHISWKFPRISAGIIESEKWRPGQLGDLVPLDG